ncbi:hypothetical protein CHS0354_011318 [Potamilus streckersoni]|uniref:Cytochrome P450 n=1 Tax=Potamilus streckersoni TaxID=2493646 RepID=A0AAE0S8R9_9BIVA|nr:hypothetical protein CHS0354_011318 [Potamilus streckersoni]
MPALMYSTGLNVFIAVVLGYIFYKIVAFIVWYKNLRRIFKDCPGPKDGHWLLGNMYKFPKPGQELLNRFQELGRQYRRYYVLWFGPFQPIIFVCHPTTVKQVLKTSEPKPTLFGGAYRHAIPWLGRGLLIADGTRWARSRRLLTPAFHFDILKPYVAISNDAANILIEKLEPFVNTAKYFEVFEVISLCTLDIILRCAFSYNTNCQRGLETLPYIAAVNEISETLGIRNRTPYLFPDFIFYLSSRGRKFQKNCKYVHKISEEIIEKRRETLRKEGLSSRKYLDFLDTLLTAKDESGIGLTQEEIRNEVDTFLFEGHDTTASGISWTLYSLAEHPEIQSKVYEEINNVLQASESDDLQWEDLPKLEYLTMVIKEGMRFHCPVFAIQRQFTKDFELDGHAFPAGTVVSVQILNLHHNKDVWDNPEEFIPERFSSENSVTMDSYQFVPFSAGPRNCIGQHFAMHEMKVVISKLIHRYRFEPEPNYVPEKKPATVMRTSNGIRMRISKR